MNYYQALKHLETVSYSKGTKLGLGRIKKILNSFNNPYKNLKIIHIAGTNGKGSTAVYLARLLESSGYKVGLYTSPHLLSYTERIAINQREITKKDLSKYLYKAIKKSRGSLTEFELLTVACILYFSDKKVDFAVMETGLGGRLDATNAFSPILTIITNISYDHTQILGKSLGDIAKDKAGIIKPYIPLITAEKNKKILKIFNRFCIKNKSPLIKIQQNEYKSLIKHFNPNNYHMKNAVLSLKAFHYMIENNLIPKKRITLHALKLNNIPGRFEEINRNEIHIILDGAHNEDGIKNLKKAVRLKYPHKKIILIMGALRTKSIKNMIKAIVPITDIFIATKGSYYLFRKPEELIKCLPKNTKYIISDSIQDAYMKAKYLYNKNNIILITGSLYLIGEFKKIYKSFPFTTYH